MSDLDTGHALLAEDESAFGDDDTGSVIRPKVSKSHRKTPPPGSSEPSKADSSTSSPKAKSQTASHKASAPSTDSATTTTTTTTTTTSVPNTPRSTDRKEESLTEKEPELKLLEPTQVILPGTMPQHLKIYAIRACEDYMRHLTRYKEWESRNFTQVPKLLTMV